MQFVFLALILCVAAVLVIGWNRERARNAPLRSEIKGQVCFEAALGRVSQLWTGWLRGSSGEWVPLRGPKRLIVGTDAFIVSAPQALREYVPVAWMQAMTPEGPQMRDEDQYVPRQGHMVIFDRPPLEGGPAYAVSGSQP